MKAILRAPELWLTSLIALPGLVYDIHHHGLALYGSWIIAVLAGLLPLLATGLVQGLLRIPKWPLWLQVLTGCLAGGLLVGYFYYYALLPPHLLDRVNGVIDEGRGNDIAIYDDESQNFAIIGAGAAVLSRLLGAVILRLGNRPSR